MTYRHNVQRLCDRLGIDNPIQEKDVKVVSLSFLINGEWHLIPDTDMNRAGRLFFQDWFWAKFASGIILEHHYVDDLLESTAKTHFKDLWDDAEEKGRALISALKQSSAVRIHWKY
jgi:hypothetical protein